MSIKTKNAGAYADIVGVFHKRAGTYEAVQGIYAKVGGVYGRVDGVAPSLVVSRASGVGPLGVVFDATATTAPSGDPFHDLLYFFDFGDGTSENYTYGTLAGTTKNRFVGGPVSCHVYETPGSYTATLWVYDGEALYGPVTQAITVADPDVVFSGANTICVSTSGDFTGAPSGATQVTSSNFNTVISTYFASGKRVLLRCGETFNVSGNATAVNVQTATIGSFGSGAKPILNATATSTQLIRLQQGSSTATNNDDIRVVGLRFVGNGLATTQAVFFSQFPLNTYAIERGKLLIHKCEVNNTVGGYMLANCGMGTIVSASTVESLNNGTPLAGNTGIFTSYAKYLGTIDCSLDNNGGAEHCHRSQGAKYEAIISNSYFRAPNNKSFLTVRGLENDVTEYVCASYNFADGRDRLSTDVVTELSFNPQNNTAIERLDTVIVESNFVLGHPGPAASIAIQGQNFTVRNNIIYRPVMAVNDAIVSVGNGSPGYFPNSENIYFKNNTIVCDRVGLFTVHSISTTAVNIKIEDTIVWTPNADSNRTIFTTGSMVTSSIGTTTSANARTVNPLFNGALTSLAGYKLQTGSPYKNAGNNLSNWIDGLGFLRQVSGQFDAGALNSVDKQTDAWTLID